jgi:hypothetical protein
MAMAEDKRITAQQLVARFKARSGNGFWINIDRAQLADGLQNRIVTPHIIAQNRTNLCAIASFVYEWIQDDPIGYAELGISLFETGAGRIGRGAMSGKPVKPSDDLRKSRIPYVDPHAAHRQQMNHADWVILASIRESLNLVLNYTADNEGQLFGKIGPVNYNGDVAESFKAAGYSKIIDKTHLDGAGYENLMEASDKFELGYRIVLYINSCILKDSDINDSSKGSKHAVGLKSPILVNVVGAEQSVFPFKLFTWGNIQQVPARLSGIPLKALLKNYYGFIGAKY